MTALVSGDIAFLRFLLTGSFIFVIISLVSGFQRTAEEVQVENGYERAKSDDI